VQAGLDDGRHQATVVPTNSLNKGYQLQDTHVKKDTDLNALRVHLVVLVGLCPIKTGVPFLADKQVREVDLLEFQLDGFYELGGHKVGCLGTCNRGPFCEASLQQNK
jgi:hypothetical protein